MNEPATIQNPPCFELVNYKDLFQKAESDLSSLHDLVNSYDLFNFLCTINHLHDWVAKDPRFSNVSIPSRNEGDLKVVRELCNRAKHFRKDSAPDTAVRKGYGMGRFGIGQLGAGEPSYTVEIDGQKMPVLEICEKALAIWKAFLAGMPVSTPD